MQLGLMPGTETIDALFVMKRTHEKYRDKGKKLFMCFVNFEKAFDRVPRKVMECAMKKTSLSEIIVRAVMNFYQGAKTNGKVGLQLCEKFLEQVGVHQGSVLSSLVFAIVADLMTEYARKVLKNEILYPHNLVLTNESMKDLREVFEIKKKHLRAKG